MQCTAPGLPKNMQILPVDSKNLREFAGVHVRTWQQAYRGALDGEFLDSLSVQSAADRYEQLCRRAGETGTEYYLACVDGRPAGRLVINPCRDDDLAEEWGEVSAIYLLEEHWGRGYGGPLMDHALVRLRAMGFAHAAVWVMRENARACRFYEKHGFVADGTQKPLNFGGTRITVKRYIRKNI